MGKLCRISWQLLLLTLEKKAACSVKHVLKEYLNQQREIKHQEAVIEKLRSFNREKSIKRAESREKMLENVFKPVEKPMEAFIRIFI